MVTDDQRFFAGITLTAISSSFFARITWPERQAHDPEAACGGAGAGLWASTPTAPDSQPAQRHRRNSDKQLGTSLVVADRLLLADEILGNVFQQVGFLEGFSKKGVDPDLSREAPVFVRGAG